MRARAVAGASVALLVWSGCGSVGGSTSRDGGRREDDGSSSSRPADTSSGKDGSADSDGSNATIDVHATGSGDAAAVPDGTPADNGESSCTGTLCAGQCSDLSTDMLNCGLCGNACASFQTCKAGSCTSSQTCPGAPAAAPTQAGDAYTTLNSARSSSGIPCASLNANLDAASGDHCQYYAANNTAANSMCVANPHVEVAGCADFVAAQFYERDTAAGYTGEAVFEDMAFEDDGAVATKMWIDSVWHRVPVLSPWIRDIGYGGATGCDTMDFGVGATTLDTATAVYPYPGQTMVPTSFNGADEGPEPPVPPAGWPSGYPIIVYLKQAMTASVHTLTVLGSTTPIAHQLISPGDASAMGLLTDEFILYANAPLSSSTHYHVHVEATGSTGSAVFDWVFATM